MFVLDPLWGPIPRNKQDNDSSEDIYRENKRSSLRKERERVQQKVRERQKSKNEIKRKNKKEQEGIKIDNRKQKDFKILKLANFTSIFSLDIFV